MAYAFDKKTSFSLEGSRWRRLNPDGTYPAVDRQIGFLGTIDTSSLTSAANMVYRLNGQGAWTTIVVDFTAMTIAIPAAATVAEVVTGLNIDAAFSAASSAETIALPARVLSRANFVDFISLATAITAFLFVASQTNP